MNLPDRITIDPAVMIERPCIRGLRLLAAYPYLEAADIEACLGYAAMRVDELELALEPA